MKRLLFTLQNAYFYRHQIKYLLGKKKHKITKITRLNPAILRKCSIRYLAIDFDGVLVTQGQSLPNNEIKQWLINFSRKFDNRNIFILSNKLTPERIEYFNKYFPSIRCVSRVRKKPYPDGLLNIQKIVNCKKKPYVLALIDDRILTGYLASILARSFPILITSPYKNYKSHPFQETFFGVLRFIEQAFFS